MKKRISFNKVCQHLNSIYGDGVIARLQTNGGSIVPKTYIHYSTNTIFTRDKELAKIRGYKYFEI